MFRTRLTRGGAESVTYNCPSCGTPIIHPLHWFKSHCHYRCDGCGIVVLLDDDRLTPPAFAHLQRVVNVVFPGLLSIPMLLRSGYGFEVLAEQIRKLIIP